MNYFFYEDLVNSTSVKIHQKKCGYVKNESTDTTKWHEFETLDEAESKAKELSNQYGKGWKLAECCFSWFSKTSIRLI